MKVRSGFVSNSSSCSFTVKLVVPMTPSQFLLANVQHFRHNDYIDFETMATIQRQLAKLGWTDTRQEIELNGMDSENFETFSWFEEDPHIIHVTSIKEVRA